jgi:exosortase B
MSDSTSSAAETSGGSLWPQRIGINGGVSTSAVLVFLVALMATYLPTFAHLTRTTWATDEQGHGPLIFAAAAWLLWSTRSFIFEGEARPALKSGFALLTVSMAMFAVGRSQGMIELEAFSFLSSLASGFLLLHSGRALRRAWFPLFFLLFMVPLPGVLVQAITMPLKSAVSVVAESVLYHVGYPIGRSGVTLTIGPYQLLVADACSGLNSLFTLEALGILYMNIMNYQSKVRNALLAIFIVPISFVSNVARVIVLVLITYYFGDEAGQGFAHGFAGIVLFSIALVLTYGLDRLLAARFDDKGGARGPRN